LERRGFVFWGARMWKTDFLVAMKESLTELLSAHYFAILVK
jgi:hypothetical protein